MMKTMTLIDVTALDGSSPPGVFVGRFGYPKVFVGPLIPPVHGDTEVLDTPEEWIGRSLEEIVGFRSQLVRGMHRTHVLDVDSGGEAPDLTHASAPPCPFLHSHAELPPRRPALASFYISVFIL